LRDFERFGVRFLAGLSRSGMFALTGACAPRFSRATCRAFASSPYIASGATGQPVAPSILVVEMPARKRYAGLFFGTARPAAVTNPYWSGPGRTTWWWRIKSNAPAILPNRRSGANAIARFYRAPGKQTRSPANVASINRCSAIRFKVSLGQAKTLRQPYYGDDSGAPRSPPVTGKG
jgi:hypothetical protein